AVRLKPNSSRWHVRPRASAVRQHEGFLERGRARRRRASAHASKKRWHSRPQGASCPMHPLASSSGAVWAAGHSKGEMTRNPNRKPGGNNMAFDALEVAIQLCAALREPLAKLAQHDPVLAEQANRALKGIPLQLSEGRRRAGKDRMNRYRIADGSADELNTALRVAKACAYLDD